MRACFGRVRTHSRFVETLERRSSVGRAVRRQAKSFGRKTRCRAGRYRPCVAQEISRTDPRRGGGDTPLSTPSPRRRASAVFAVGAPLMPPFREWPSASYMLSGYQEICSAGTRSFASEERDQVGC